MPNIQFSSPKYIIERTMWHFYLSLLRQVPKTLVSAAGIVSTIVALLFALLALLNRSLAKALALRWEGVSPGWAILPILLVLVYMLAKANYEAFTEIGGIPDSPKTRRRFHKVFHERPIPAYQGARQVLERMYQVEQQRGLRPTVLSEHLRFAVIEPSETVFQKTYDALESPTYPLQFVGADFILAYRRMTWSIDSAVSLGGLREDTEIAQWRALDEAFKAEIRALLNDPEFSTMRKIVRGM